MSSGSFLHILLAAASFVALLQVAPRPPPVPDLCESMDKQSSDEELMARIAKGDEYAFQILVERHQTLVLNLIYRFIGDRYEVSRPGPGGFSACLAGSQEL